MNIKIFKTNQKTQRGVLKEIAENAKKWNFSKTSDPVLKDLLKREKTGTTGFENGVAIPHARSKSIIEPVVIIARMTTPVDWKSLDGKPADVAISILIPDNESAGTKHMETLANIASLLMDEKNIEVFKKGTITNIKKMLQIKSEKTTKKAKNSPKQDGKYDVVAVTTCPTGVAHTNMAADALEKYATDNKIKIKVERQAAQGRVSVLTPGEIKGAKYVILAAGKQIEEKERFEGKKVYETKVVAPIKNAKEVFRLASKNEKVLAVSRKSVAKKAFNQGGAKPMQALMAGVSYMIPFVVMGGILIALSLGIAGKSVPGKALQIPDYTFWNAVNGVGVVGFKLMIPILGGFIASAIAGRGAIAPAMVLSFVVGNQDDQLFNWSKFDFGDFGKDSAALGFLGAIAVGFAVGYAVKAWMKYISIYIPKALKPVEPIIFIPIIITISLWALFAFFVYVPLYWISQGLNLGIGALIDHNLFFLAAMIIGAMISFDMGGPINKIAFLFAGGLIAQGKPEVMGAAATAIAIPPLGCGLSILFSKLFGNKSRFDEQDRGNAISAIAMSIVGITEGAIPFAVKYPKQAITANVIAGSIGAAIASLFQISDLAQHGGPIVYIVGAIGKDGVTNYLWGLFFLMAIVAGGLIHVLVFNLMFKFTKDKTKNSKKVKRTTKAKVVTKKV